MKSISLTAMLAILPLVAAGEDGFEALFNGKNLDGWKGDPKLWSVKEGEIVGTTVGQPVPGNTFLIWQGENTENFVLKAKVRVEGENNSGIQYRSEVVDPEAFVLKGFQCDVHPAPNYVGMLYGEKTGRGIIAERGQKVTISGDGEKKVDPSIDTEAKVDISKWNEYTVIAAGDRVLHLVNGKVTVDVTDQSPENPKNGVVGLQLHAGKPMTVHVSEVGLKKLDLEAAVAAQEAALKAE